jgi:hypothetical protein
MFVIIILIRIIQKLSSVICFSSGLEYTTLTEFHLIIDYVNATSIKSSL